MLSRQNAMKDEFRAAIESRCHGDKSQLSAIFSSSRRIFVEAPAGFGKTTVMTGRACWLLVSGEVPQPKRILALTFSVAAARRMRMDMNATMSALSSSEAPRMGDRVIATNFHGLAWSLLRRYWKFLSLPSRVDDLSILDERSAISELASRGRSLAHNEMGVINDFLRFTNSGKDKELGHLIRPFNEVVRKRFVPNGMLPYSAMISLAIELLIVCPGLRPYLAAAFPVVLVDEAQDTNGLCYIFLRGLLLKESALCMFGDPVQRVYGFIGAMPQFKERVSADFGLSLIELECNHRFPKDSVIGELGAAIRAHMRIAPVHGNPQLPLFVGATQQDEANTVVAKVVRLIQNKKGSVAVLVRKRGNLARLIMAGLDGEGISYFNGLFSDTHSDFIKFNAFALSRIIDALPDEKMASKSTVDTIINSISNCLSSDAVYFEYGHSYALLLEALRRHLKADCLSMTPSERYNYIVGIFSEKSLRRFSDYLDVAISVMTIHSAKGLEWTNVFLPGLTCFDWPNRICSTCRNAGMCSCSKQRCRINDINRVPNELIEEIGLLYVGITRARNSVYASASMNRMTKYGNYQAACPSCLVSLPGITAISWSLMDKDAGY